jgi:ABC-type phosphate transport system ATPase subunit
MAKRIDVKSLDIYYGGFHAVEDVSMTVEPRTVTAFIGPSGCGKSTLLRTLNRMHEVIPGAHTSRAACSSTELTCTARESIRWQCAGSSAWSSSGPTRSRQCRSSTTSRQASR